MNKESLKLVTSQINMSNYRRVESVRCSTHTAATAIAKQLSDILGEAGHMLAHVECLPGSHIQVSYYQGASKGTWEIPGMDGKRFNLRNVVSHVVSGHILKVLDVEEYALVAWQSGDRIGQTLYEHK